MDVESAIDLLSKRHCYLLLANLCWSRDMRFNELKNEVKCTSKQLSLLLKLLEKNGLIISFYDKSMSAYFYVATKRANKLLDVVKKIDGV